MGRYTSRELKKLDLCKMRENLFSSDKRLKSEAITVFARREMKESLRDDGLVIDMVKTLFSPPPVSGHVRYNVVKALVYAARIRNDLPEEVIPMIYDGFSKQKRRSPIQYTFAQEVFRHLNDQQRMEIIERELKPPISAHAILYYTIGGHRRGSKPIDPIWTPPMEIVIQSAKDLFCFDEDSTREWSEYAFSIMLSSPKLFKITLEGLYRGINHMTPGGPLPEDESIETREMIMGLGRIMHDRDVEPLVREVAKNVLVRLTDISDTFIQAMEALSIGTLGEVK